MCKKINGMPFLWRGVLALCTGFLLVGLSPDISNAFEFPDLLTERLTLHGFLQQGVSVNMEDPIETDKDDQFYVSMARSTFYLDANMNFDWLKFTGIMRYDLEYETDYLDRLNDMSSADIMQELNGLEFREWYADISAGTRVTLRLGRQQIIWGNTDFFRAMDIIHGYDHNWRSFLEGENEQLRKPLVMGNLEIQVPELSGGLQLIVRPGFDEDEDIGNNYDIYGGRWANQPNKGVNFNDLVKTNLDHTEGDQEDPTYGVRWSGQIGSVDYSLNYLHTFNNDPVVNPSSSIGGTPYEEDPEGALGDFIYPQVDVAGVTFNYYLPKPIDLVLSGEFVYTWDQPFNYGSDFLGGALPGFAGIVEKDTVRSMIRFDKNNFGLVEKIFRARRPGFLSIQVFDTWIMDYDDDDDIVTAGYGANTNEHDTVITAILNWNYDNDYINPGIAWGTSIQNGGGFVIPNITFIYGNWQLRFEYDLFYNASGGKDVGEIEDDATMFDYFDNNDQFYVRLTYYF